MTSIVRSRYFRGFIVFLYACAALIVAGLGVSLLVGATGGHGSSSSNVLLFFTGLFLLILSPAVFTLGIVYWNSSRPDRGDTDT
ncbi:MAG: hypothetical protein ABSA96_20460 [Candidatus Acidiferrales bacterium]|jgi:hypothetical protein